MKLISGNSEIEWKEPLGIGLGNFDGLHIGHMVLINTLIDECTLNGFKSMLYTFSCHPESIIRKKLVTPLIMDIEKKQGLLDETRLDYLYLEDFNEGFSHMEPQSFIKEILVGRFRIKIAVAGFDYSYGYKGRGGVEMLKNLGKIHGFNVVVIPPVKLGREIVSSTLIRQYALSGDMQKVSRMLGRHFSVSGIVAQGLGIGRTLGIPTANIITKPGKLIPADGVYITRTLTGGRMYPSITNIGRNPTFNGLNNTMETHILDYCNDIYNEAIEVFFEKRLRGEIKFTSAQLLMERINKDIATVRKFFHDR